MKILVGVDKTEGSQQALQYSCHLLEHFDAEVDALYVKADVVDSVSEGAYAPFTTRSDLEKEIEGEAEKTVEQIFETCEICLGGKVPCAPLVAVGDPADEILLLANEGRYDLIVLGSQTRSLLRGLLLGSVHSKVLHHALQPVLIMRNFRPIQKILVAYRGSQCDQEALDFIAPLFAKNKPEITILHVQETTLHETAEYADVCLITGEDTLKKYSYTPLKKLVQGDFVDEIVKAMAGEKYDLLVLGAYGRKHPKFLRMISDEALNLVRLATLPVLVFRQKTAN